MQTDGHPGRGPSKAEIVRVFAGLPPYTVREVTAEMIVWLRWENEYPEAVWLPPQEAVAELRSWGYSFFATKRWLLRALCRLSSLAPFEDELIDLVLAVARRRHEEYDGYYSRLVRQLDGPRLRGGLSDCLAAPEPDTRVRAAWLLDVLDHPEIPPTRTRWRTWTAARGLPHRIDRLTHVKDDRDRRHQHRHRELARARAVGGSP